MKDKTKVNITDEGVVVVTIGNESDEFNHNEVNAFIHRLKTAQSEADQLKKLADKKQAIKKQYNGAGKPVEKEVTHA
jgi:phage host-nuclease inhibitor protein Gam